MTVSVSKIHLGLGLFGAAAVLMPLAATSTAQAASTEIPIIVKDTTSGYWQIVLAGARKAGKDLGIKVPELGAQSESDVNGQVAALEKAAAGNPLAIVIAPTSFAPLGKPIDAAAKTVKIIGVDSGADTTSFTSMLTTDNVQGGRVAADELAEGIKAATGKAEGNVALLTSIAGSGSLDQRAAGFKEELAAKYPDLKVTVDKVADGKVTTGQELVTGFLAADPSLKGVFASNLTMAVGAGKAVADAGSKATVVGFDSDPRLVKMLTAGSVYALIVQDPFRMGYEGIKTALAASKGESVPPKVDTGVTAITKANMASAHSQDLLNPKLN